MGLGPSRWDSVFFVEVKCIFSTTSEVKIFSKSKEKEVVEETEAKEDHWCDRTRSRHDRRNRLVAAAVRARGTLGFATGASGPSRNRSVRSRT
jgi:hypothetical protein